MTSRDEEQARETIDQEKVTPCEEDNNRGPSSTVDGSGEV